MDAARSSGPLQGLRVLDIATLIAAPFAASLVADYGADVTKVELPGAGDAMRGFPPFKQGKSLWWKVTNRNKKLITLDIRKPQGQALFRRLVADMDVLLENFRPGTLDRWGLTREELWKIQPRLVIVRVTGHGQDGPYRSRPGFARVFEAMGGLTYISGDPDGEPMHTGYPLGDPIGGLFAAAGLLAALWRVASTGDGGGEEIDVSMTESMFRLLEFLPIEYDQLGTVRQRCGNANPYSAPARVYRTADERFVSLAGSTQAVFEANARAIGREDLIGHPDFRTNADRVRHAARIDSIFVDWIARHTCDEVLAAFDAAGGAIAPVYSIAQIFKDPQFRHRETIVRVPDEDFGEVAMPNVVPRFRHARGAVRQAAGGLGSANRKVYGALGMGDDEMRCLHAQGVI